ncbi:helix-turn-helix domain-containing protein [Streptomyces sp. NPDC087844]|uniref:nSTAND1 domain-containing NTPase n=1 Tax=Streptomyces sp. NPDC087844 TaxID=3365805 RepID=UPI0038132AFA
MARSERPLDSGDGAVLRFAAALRQLRQRAGSPTYRVLSGRTHYSVTTLANAAAGRALPSMAVTLAYVRACDGDEREWELLWKGAAAELAVDVDTGQTGGRDVAMDEPAPPYPGLAAFQPEDGERFFGRDRLTQNLLDRLSEERLVAVFGASGSGKSSLLRAGLLPRLRAEESQKTVVLFTPGPHPLEECAVQLATPAQTTAGQMTSELGAEPANLHRVTRQILAGQPSGAEIILVIDQFEEVFTLCRSVEERASFISALLTATQAPNSRCRVVLGVRADFYVHCTHHADLITALARGHITIGPMTAEELRQTVVQPALRAGLSVEGSLVAALVAESHGRPGVMPLLAHALLETWRRRRGNALTLNGYQATGGMEGALTRTAEEFHGSLTPPQQRVARKLFLRLTALGEGTEDTKRRLPRGELDTQAADVAVVLERAVRARILTLDDAHVDIAHEALIRCWPRLHQWLAEDRDSLRRHRQLAEAVLQWESLGRDPDALYRGRRLAMASEFTDDMWYHDMLTEPERTFVKASLAAEHERGLRDRRRTQRLRRIVALLAVSALLATCAAGYALHAQERITQQRNNILSRTVAAEALTLRVRQPGLRTQLMMAAYQLSPTPEARNGLLSAVDIPLRGSRASVSAVAFDSAGHRSAVGGDDGTVQLWDTSVSGRPVRTGVTGRAGRVASIAISPDGRTLAVGSYDRSTRLWNVSDISRPVLTATLAGHTDTVFSVAFSPDGKTLATGSYDHTVRLWDVSHRHRPTSQAVLRGHRLNVKAVAYSRDGKMLATGGDDRTVQLWDVRRPDRPVRLSVLTGHTNFVTSLMFSQDGYTLVSGSDDQTIRLWDITRLGHPAILSVLDGHSDVVISVALSVDGRQLASGSYDGSVRLWNTANLRHVELNAVITGYGGAINAVTFAPDGRTLLTGSDNPSARIWQTDPVQAIAHICAQSPAAITRSQWSRYFPGITYRPPCGFPGRAAEE